jgi:hypothetical protein
VSFIRNHDWIRFPTHSADKQRVKGSYKEYGGVKLANFGVAAQVGLHGLD